MNSDLVKFLGTDFDFIDSGFSNGEENMRFDTDRKDAFYAGNAKPMFRIYGWKPWCVSLGFNQKESDIDRERCEARGIEIVRRPTGGRAVLHADEITYSVVCGMPPGISPQDLYRDIHIFLLSALHELGLKEVGFQKSQPDFRNMYRSEERSVACFASSARWEIESNGKKLIGSAQRAFGSTLLQHGSILLDSGHDQLADIIAGSTDDKRESLKEWTRRHSVTATEIAGRKITYEEAAAAFRKVADL